MNQKEIKHRFSLTFLYTAMGFIAILLTVLTVGAMLYILIRLGILSGTDQSDPSSLQIILFFGIASLPAGAFISFAVGAVILKPVNVLISRLNSLAAGNYKVRIQTGSLAAHYPIVRDLTNSFNRLAQELEGTEMLRSDFINNFSHEFKTPIVSIAGFAQLLRRGAVEPAQQEEYLSIIETESLRLSQMATNVLNLTKVENQTVLTDVTRYNLSEQLRSCILLLSHKWEQKNLNFALDFPEYTIQANQELMKQVWINLLDNAIKFSLEPGVIALDIHQTDSTITVAISNTGPEIPADKQGKIFNKFYQADESHAAQGNGVGLAIVKRVVELHRGTVRVTSHQGQTTFTVTLPNKP